MFAFSICVFSHFFSILRVLKPKILRYIGSQSNVLLYISYVCFRLSFVNCLLDPDILFASNLLSNYYIYRQGVFYMNYKYAYK